jgi:hypothetical protein
MNAISFRGLLLPFQSHHLLVYGPEAEALGEPLFGPPVHLRPGYRLFTENNYLLPTEVIDDIGQHFVAPECYEWIEQRGDQFPRADAIGALPSGERRSVFMKELDLVDLAVFASPLNEAQPIVRVDLAIEARAVADGCALTPVPFPIEWLARAAPCYRLAPGVFGAMGAAILNHLLATRRWDWRLTFDDLDDQIGVD